jgi:DNA-binding CsgD family transcriptional regulator
MRALAAGGYTIKQIADATGYSPSTVSKYLK